MEQIDTFKYRLSFLNDYLEIGGANSFKPVISLRRFISGPEKHQRTLDIELALALPGASLSVDLPAEKLTYENANYGIIVYRKALSDLGDIEFELVLKKRPPVNQFSFNINSTGLVSAYQPALTPSEIAEGSFRPPEVVGSYAFYHNEKGGIHSSQLEAELYKTGKAFHIYRPLATDALGNKIWGTLSILGNTMTIILPAAWLDSAIYPVSIDPDIGYTTGGGTNRVLTHDTLLEAIGHITDARGGIARSVSIYARLGSGASAAWQGGLYDGGDNLMSPQTATGVITSASVQWWTLYFAGGPSFLPNTEYRPALFADFNAVNVINLRFDAGVGANTRYNVTTETYNIWPASPTWIQTSDKYSVYATYVAGAFGNNAPKMVSQNYI